MYLGQPDYYRIRETTLQRTGRRASSYEEAVMHHHVDCVMMVKGSHNVASLPRCPLQNDRRISSSSVDLFTFIADRLPRREGKGCLRGRDPAKCMNDSTDASPTNGLT